MDYCADDVTCSTTDQDPMDVEGHGTHVAGIAAANGTIKGVAPDAYIMMIKAGNSSGSLFDDDIIKGLQWCTDNSSIYNISVISMSLGGGSYANNCDTDPLTSYIQDAVDKNISVVVSTGNEGSTTQIGAPACVTNATPIGSIRKNDATMDYNRNSLVQLVAPGVSINSTYLTASGYGSLSGTSMAAPHVSGIIALMGQYLSLSRQTKTPQQIETILNNTGKIIYDSGSNLNYSRVNAYLAILSLDATTPNVTLISPTDNNVTSLSNQTFRCNASDNFLLANITFYLWNSSDFLINKTIFPVTGVFNQTEINISNLSLQTYSWSCSAKDNNSNSFIALNRTLYFGNVSITSSTPLNNTQTNNASGNFTCTSQVSSDFLLSNISFYLWNQTGDLIYNETKNISGKSNVSEFNYSFSLEQIYSWNCFAVANNSETDWLSYNQTFVYDVTSPNITLISPADETSSTTADYNFTFNVSDLGDVDNCSLISRGVNYNFLSSVSKDIANGMYNTSIPAGVYPWYVNCTDKAGNVANSSTWTYIVQAVVRTSSGGGGGGGGGGAILSGGTTYQPSTTQLEKGYSKGFKEEDVVKFSLRKGLKKENHTLKIEKIFFSFVNITINSSPINLIVFEGQEKKINITSSDYYELLIKVVSIEKNSANITIKEIRELIASEESELNLTEDRHIHEDKDVSKDYIVWIIVIVALVVILILIRALTLYFVRIDKKNKVENKRNKRKKKIKKKRTLFIEPEQKSRLK